MSAIKPRRLRRAALMGGTAGACVFAVLGLSATSGHAQAQAQNQAQNQVQTQDGDALIEQMIVTGSRIARSGLTTPTPVTVLDSDAIQLSGELNLGNLLNQLPALGSTFTSASSTGFIGTTGIAILDLRRLGTDRTLVLVDGRRHVASNPGAQAVDINTIPVDLIDRVEVITGGASAIYGADAVTGVVNFITKDDFEGVSSRAQFGISDRGDSESWFVSLTGGGTFADGRGNAVLSVEYNDSEGILGTDRPHTAASNRYVVNPADTGVDDGIPDEILVPNGTLHFLNDSGVVLGFDSECDPVLGAAPGSGTAAAFGLCVPGDSLTFSDTGALITFDRGTVFDPPFGESQGGDGQLISPIGSIQPDTQRISINSKLNYQLVDQYLNLFVEAKFTNVQAQSFGQPSFDFVTALFVDGDNAFLPTALSDRIAADGIGTLNNATAGGVFLQRFHTDLGLRSDDVERNTFRIVAGMEGEFDNGWRYEFSYVYGRSAQNIVALNNRINDRFLAAVDSVALTQADIDAGLQSDAQLLRPGSSQVVLGANAQAGDIICRSVLDPTSDNTNTGEPIAAFARDGCVPLNIIGNGLANPAAVDFVFADTVRRDTIEQSVATLVLSGDTQSYFELPAGPIGFAVGGEFRFEESVSRPAVVDGLGLTFGNVLGVTEGNFNVYEGFAEVSIPVLADLPAVERLVVEAAGRISDYNSIGGTETWMVRGDWTPVSDIRFRVTYSEAIRAPNISELFSPQDQNFFDVNDPCSTENLGDAVDPALRAANCAALGAPPGFVSTADAATIPGVSGGNPLLMEESAESLTIGAIITPRWLPGFSLTVDYWDIEITDAISPVGEQAILDRCVDSPGGIDNQFCPLITRDGQFEITNITQIEQNLQKLEASGIDVEMNYNLDLADLGAGDWGTVDVRFIGTWVDTLREFPFQDEPVQDNEVGELGDPEFAFNLNTTWNWNGLQVNYELRWFDSMLREDDDEIDAVRPDRRDPLETGGTFFHDIQVNYQLNAYVQLYGGVNNLADKLPPGGVLATNDDGAIFDNIGRFFFFGARGTF